jgi:hypothetical protein
MMVVCPDIDHSLKVTVLMISNLKERAVSPMNFSKSVTSKFNQYINVIKS